MKNYTEKELEQIRDDYRENVNWSVPKEVSDAYETLMSALDDYITVIAEFEFRDGFKYAQMQKRGAVK